MPCLPSTGNGTYWPGGNARPQTLVLCFSPTTPSRVAKAENTVLTGNFATMQRDKRQTVGLALTPALARKLAASIFQFPDYISEYNTNITNTAQVTPPATAGHIMYCCKAGRKRPGVARARLVLGRPRLGNIHSPLHKARRCLALTNHRRGTANACVFPAGAEHVSTVHTARAGCGLVPQPALPLGTHSMRSWGTGTAVWAPGRACSQCSAGTARSARAGHHR